MGFTIECQRNLVFCEEMRVLPVLCRNFNTDVPNESGDVK